MSNPNDTTEYQYTIYERRDDRPERIVAPATPANSIDETMAFVLVICRGVVESFFLRMLPDNKVGAKVYAESIAVAWKRTGLNTWYGEPFNGGTMMISAPTVSWLIVREAKAARDE